MEDLSAGIGSFLQLPALFQESHHGRLLGSWNLGADPCVQLDPPIRHSTSAGRTDLRLRQLRPGLGLRSLDGVEQDPTAADRRSDPPKDRWNRRVSRTPWWSIFGRPAANKVRGRSSLDVLDVLDPRFGPRSRRRRSSLSASRSRRDT